MDVRKRAAMGRPDAEARGENTWNVVKVLDYPATSTEPLTFFFFVHSAFPPLILCMAWTEWLKFLAAESQTICPKGSISLSLQSLLIASSAPQSALETAARLFTRHLFVQPTM